MWLPVTGMFNMMLCTLALLKVVYKINVYNYLRIVQPQKTKLTRHIFVTKSQTIVLCVLFKTSHFI